MTLTRWSEEMKIVNETAFILAQAEAVIAKLDKDGGKWLVAIDWLRKAYGFEVKR
ncbi:hypothetical protein vBYenSP400_13 [Yersinia phage vB_YenS_P400]|nr:hypothetical protein vBYenSP400_13 [Yersinia phage vB_YenS_P400]